MNTLNVIDLFCGAGGLSEGFRQSGYRVVAGVDIDKEAGMTFQKNFSEAKIICNDLRNLSTKELLELSEIRKEDVFCIIGGPPCQGYSMVGKRFIDDPRNVLFKEFVRIVNDIKPVCFIMENVTGLISMDNGRFKKEILEAFESIGYKTEVKIMNAADYGVPQVRKRTIFIGNRIGKQVTFPKETHHEKGIEDKFRWVSVEEAIGDLPPLGNEFGENCMLYTQPAFCSYQAYMRGNISFEEYLSMSYNISINHGAEEVYNHWTSKSNENTIKKFIHIPPGCNWQALPEELKTNGKYSNLYRRLHPDKPSVTLTNIRKSMFIHPWEDRLITVREGARIQSFPDHFIFYGTLNSQQQQIGNAVPPILGYVLGKELQKLL